MRISIDSKRWKQLFLGIMVLSVVCVHGGQISLGTGLVQAAEPSSSAKELVVFAAASLTEPFREIAKQLELAYPGLKVVYNFGGSSALRTQLEQGAHADVFAAADAIQIEQAKKNGIVQGDTPVFAQNRLVVIVPLANPAKIKTFCGLGKPGIKLDLAHANVPIGNYSRQAIAKASTACGADFEERTLNNVVSEEENVKQVVTKIQLGEADAGIVYASDVTIRVNKDVHTITLDDAYNQIASYPIAVTAVAKSRNMAEVFVTFVLSPEGQVILGGHGFMPVKNRKLSQ
ncbi:MAG: molybdate ABC transporter substrate-binding protein [Deltaproteobacteria bacterium]|nr:molybdate ABC transporter substrate-binding protein [Deltaproteobacteria bacterium]